MAYTILLLSAAWLIGVAFFALLRPELALACLGKMASTNRINWTELSLRMASGFAFVIYAEHSRSPAFFLVFGWFLVVTSGILLLVPRAWHHRYAVYWSKTLTPFLLRMLAPISLVAGALLLFAIH